MQIVKGKKCIYSNESKYLPQEEEETEIEFSTLLPTQQDEEEKELSMLVPAQEGEEEEREK